MTKNIVLIQSKPGLGKSTLAANVVAALNQKGVAATHLSLGDRLRAVCDQLVPSQHYEQLSQYRDVLQRHEPVPDFSLVHRIVEEYVNTNPGLSVIDGYPRYMEALEGFLQSVSKNNYHIVAVILLDGSDELATERMNSRARRSLGAKEQAAKRLASHYKTTEPVFALLAAQFPTYSIDASKELTEKTAEVMKILEKG